jgi:hypothetical protein
MHVVAERRDNLDGQNGADAAGTVEEPSAGIGGCSNSTDMFVEISGYGATRGPQIPREFRPS